MNDDALRSVLDAAVDGIIVADAQTRKVVLANRAICRMLGYGMAELTALHVADMHPAEALAGIGRQLDRLVTDKVPTTIEHPVKRKDGSIFCAAITAAPVTIQGRLCAFGNFHDVTETKRAEVTLRASEQRFRAIYDSVSDGIIVHDIETGAFIDANPRICEMFGYTRDEFLKLDIDRISTDHSSAARERTRQLTMRAAGGHPQIFEWQVRAKDGHLFWVEIALRRTAFGNRDVLISTAHDFTERKVAETRLHESQQLITGILNAIPARVFWKDKNLVYLGCNTAFARDAGFAVPEDLIGKDDFQMGWRDQAELYRGDDRRVIDSGLSKLLIEEPQTTPGGGTITLLTSKVPLRDTTGAIEGVLGMYLDITDRKRAEEAQRASEAKYRDLFQSTRDAIMVGDLSSGRLVAGNPAAVKLFGAKDEADFVSHSFLTLSPERQPDGRLSAEKVREVIETAQREGVNFFEWAHKRDNGEEFFAEVLLTRVVQGGSTLLYGTVRDITDRKRTADTLAYHDRLLHAIALCATELVAESSLSTAMPHALMTMADALRVDRMFILAEPSPEIPLSVSFAWQAQDVPQIDSSIISRFPAERELAAWQAPLLEGKPVTTYAETATELVAEIMREMKNLSTLLVPIFVSGRFWGRIAIDDCKTVRQWTSVEIDTLGTFSKVIGALLLRERVQASLQQSEERFRAVSETAQDAILLIDATGRVQYWNPAAERILGYTEEEARAKPGIIDWLVAPQLRARVAPEMTDFMATGRESLVGKTREFAATRRDGSECPVELSLATVVLGGKRFTVAILHDVTERKKAEAALLASEAQLSNALQLARAGNWAYDVAKDEFTFNDNFYRILHTTAEKIGGYTMRPGDYARRFFHPDDVAVLGRETAAAIASTDPHYSRELEHRIIFENGEVGYVTVRFHIVKNIGGKTIRIYGVNQDITERKHATEAIVYRGELLRSVNLAAEELLSIGALDETVNHVLQVIGEAVHADRVVMLEMQKPEPGSPALAFRYAWHAPDVPVILDKDSFAATFGAGPEFGTFFAPLAAGKPVMEVFGATTGSVRKLFEGLAMKSILIVPVVVDGRPWGVIGFDDCRTERRWTPVEIEILRTLADLMGTAIQRERYVTELSDANRIVQNSPTILYRMRGVPSLPMIYVSQNITLLGYDPATMIELPQFYKSLIHPDDQSIVHESMMSAATRGSEPGVVEFRLRNAGGDYRWVENRYTPIRDAAGRLIEIEGILIDVTERKATEEKIAHLARTDALSGLANRATFVDRLKQAFGAARRGAGAFAVLYIDLDHFKDINDTRGHPAGDLLLKIIADRLRAVVRDSDLVARLGGDEFAVLQAELNDLSGAGTLATKIRDAVAEPIHLGSDELHITVSVGIAAYAAETAGPDDMLAQADLALYRAKDEGRDQYRFHSPDLDEQVRERVVLGEDLRRALDRDEFELYYQPQVELLTGRIVGMEALVRWNHPARGVMLPGSFLAVAEKTGAIIGIGQWVLERACEQMHNWQKAGISPGTLAVNLSVTQLKGGPEFVKLIQSILARWELATECLELDVTESMLVHATMAQNDVLEQLQELGVNIAIDDFGTQYSSLDYLKTLHVSRLKIPRMMMRAGTEDPGSAAMVRAIIGIARELNIEVVAQGIETEAEQALLTPAASTTKVQGFYYSEPVPLAQAETLLRQRWIRRK